jgi:hypothetical protein
MEAIKAGKEVREDSDATMKNGAKAVYRLAMRRLAPKYQVTTDGWITPRWVNPLKNQN